MRLRARKLIGALAATAAVAAVVPPAGWAQAPRVKFDQASQRLVPGEAIVRFKPGASSRDRRNARAQAGVALERTLELARAQLVEVTGDVTQAVRRLERQPGVAYAQPNYRYRALVADSFIGQLWGLGSPAPPEPGVNGLAAWGTTRGAGQVIAVVDSGVDLTHPDLVPNLWSNPGEVSGNGVDDDAKGVVDDVRGADFVQRNGAAPSGNPDDFEFHGTHVAGTAAAQDDNGLGVAGVAPDARLMAVRVLDGDGGGTSADIGEGIAYAAREGADVINVSLGGPGSSDQLMSNGVDVAAQNGAVVVAAAGNDGANNDAPGNGFVPCNLPQPNLICVAAANEDGGRAGFSNFGATSVDVAAPGTNILSAKTDWGSPLFSDGFNNGSLTGWDFAVDGNGSAWGQSTSRVTEGTRSATDSAENYANNAYSAMFTANAVNLSGRRGCRMHFDLDQDVHATDLFAAGADTNSGPFDGYVFPEDPLPGFFAAEVSISDVDGRADVFPIFALETDATQSADGVYIDDLRLICRDSTYADATTSVADYDKATSGNYVEFNGTSVAAPHVAGVAALVLAADPGASAVQVVQAIKQGVTPLSSFSGLTSTGGTVDAVGAINASLGIPNTQPSQPVSAGGAGTPVPVPPTAPARAVLPARAVADRRGRLRLRVRGGALTNGALRLRANLPRAAVARTVARKSFRIGSTGRATVRVRLSSAARRVLLRAKRLRTRARVVLTNAAGLRSTSGRTIRIRLRR